MMHQLLQHPLSATSFKQESPDLNIYQYHR